LEGLHNEERFKRISDIFDVLTKAMNKSEYRFDFLLDNLTSKPAKNKVKKSSAAKPAPVSKSSNTKKKKN